MGFRDPGLGFVTFEAKSKLLKAGYIGDYIGEYFRAFITGILGVWTTAHTRRRLSLEVMGVLIGDSVEVVLKNCFVGC